jgi:branched-chain amino acid transport system substrate-binding protein
MAISPRVCARGFARLALPAALIAAAPAVKAAEPVTIPVILSLTGGASFIGTHEWQAMQLAVKAFNAGGGLHGRPVQFDVQDDQSTPQLSVQLANAAIATHAPIVIGSTLVALCNAMSPLFRNGPVQYCMSPAIHPAPGSYIYSSSVNFDDLVTTTIRYLRDRHLTRLGAIYSIDASGQDIEKANNAALSLPENIGTKMVAVAHYNTTDVSVAAQIERIKEANPQAFLAWSPGAQVATVFKGIAEAGLQVPVVTTSANMTYAQMQQYAPFLPKELYIAAAEWTHAAPGVHLDPRVEAAHRAMYSAFAAVGAKPDQPMVDGWEVASLILHVLSTLPENPNAAQVRDALAHLTNYAGVNGIYDFEKTPQRGVNAQHVVVTRWDPASQAFVMVSQPGTGEPLGEPKE